jgi:molybdopterin/thiamine biosynthesis adenylyltransferase
VLLVELTGSNTELAKNLILSGANISIFDDNTINEQDVDTNFLFGKHEIGLSVILIFIYEIVREVSWACKN